MYNYAEEKGIVVDWVPMRRADSLSAELPDGSLCIAMDPWKMESISKETVALGHELGHCCTGSFYNRFAKGDIIPGFYNHSRAHETPTHLVARLPFKKKKYRLIHEKKN